MAEISSKLSIGILGPGAIGGMLAALLWKDGHDVTCIGKKTSVAKIKKYGISFDSQLYGNFIAKPNSVEILNKHVDVLFISVKAPFMNDALKRINIDSVKSGMIVPLLNGLGYSKNIRDRLGNIVAIGTIGNVEVTRNIDQLICHMSSSRPKIEIASNFDIASTELEKLSNILNSAGFSTSVIDSEEKVIWNKLVRLNAIASLTSAYQRTIGEVRTNARLNKWLNEIVEEGALVASHEGIIIDPKEVINQINALPSSLKTSMQRDIMSKRPSEFESITGGVMRLAESYGIPIPAHKHIYNLISKKIFNL